jgi:hypothetical protein
MGFEKPPGNVDEMDVDDNHGVANLVGSARTRPNGFHVHGHRSELLPPAPRLKQMPVSSGLTALSKPRPVLGDGDIDRMLTLVATDDSSDSEGEITIPARSRRGGTGTMGT